MRSILGVVVAGLILLPSMSYAATGVATHLSALSDFATLASAIALAYANLPNFRYRMMVQDYVRSLADYDFCAVLAANGSLKSDDSWAILFRLGRLGDWNGPPAEHIKNLTPPAGSDINFQRTGDYKRFVWLYHSNLDKIIGTWCGTIAASVIWLASLDELYFPEPVSNDILRIMFLSEVMQFFAITTIFGIVCTIIHKYMWKWDTTFGRPEYRCLYWLRIASVMVYLFAIVTTSAKVNLLFPPFLTIQPASALWICAFLLVTTIGLPLLLLWQGNDLLHAMMKEARRSREKLVAALGPSGAKLLSVVDEPLHM